MVSTQHPIASPHCSESPDIEDWLASVTPAYTQDEALLIQRACRMAANSYGNRELISGVSILQHALGSAAILASMRMDGEAVAAAVLYALPQYDEDADEKLQTEFGDSIAHLVAGVAHMGQIQELSETHALGKEKDRDSKAQTEALRQMLLAMVQDIRVVLIKLAERTQTMRCLAQSDVALQRKIATETQEIFAPLANRLGVWQIKWELEDLACRYLEPQRYKQIAKLLDEKRVEREGYIAEVIALLQQELRNTGIHGEVSGRPKHINSILNKMERKEVDFTEIYDVRAVRVLVEEVKDCYSVLGIAHNLWQPIPGEFDDYIAHPKSNDYRSLHTAVIGPGGLALEVQIRTFAMHQHAEYGVAAHWRYKEGGSAAAGSDEKIAWLRQILAWKDDVADSGELMRQFKNELFSEQVFVLTPQGRVIDLPKGATPVDFAYHVHTDLGHRCRGAKVDGNMVPLNYKLANGQCVEIITTKQGAPSRDWLNLQLGYLQSQRARAKVRHWFKYQHFEENVSQGRAQLDRELHRLGVSSFNQEKLAQKFSHSKPEEFLAAIGRGDISSHQIAAAIQEELTPKISEAAKPLLTHRATSGESAAGILIEGVGNLLTNMAKCCKPAPPDSIVGYITLGRGVTIHRSDCPSMLRLDDARRKRMLAAQWGGKTSTAFAVDIEALAYDRQGLLRDISDILTREKVNVTRVNTQSKNETAKMNFTIEVADLEQLSRVLALINAVPGVTQAIRQ